MYFDCVNRILKFYERYLLWSIVPEKGMILMIEFVFNFQSVSLKKKKKKKRFFIAASENQNTNYHRNSWDCLKGVQILKEWAERKEKANKVSGWGQPGARRSREAWGGHPAPSSRQTQRRDTSTPELCPPSCSADDRRHQPQSISHWQGFLESGCSKLRNPNSGVTVSRCSHIFHLTPRLLPLISFTCWV